MDILIIEDDKLILNLLQHGIKNAGHKAFTAENAEQAISLVTSRNFDLIITDIMMPGISGLSLISILRTVHLISTPIIIMSALHNKPLLAAAFEAGANDFIAKPFMMEELEEKLRKYAAQGAW
jgi:DNA-binding response OmpR family regulator